MKLRGNKVVCAHCHTAPAWWQVTTCSLCGHTVCRRHASLIRRSHSTVLSVVCEACAQRGAVSYRTQPVKHLLTEKPAASHVFLKRDQAGFSVA